MCVQAKMAALGPNALQQHIICPKIRSLNVFRGAFGALHWWQQKHSYIFKDKYSDFNRWVMSLGGAEDVQLLRKSDYMAAFSRRSKTDVYFRQPPHSCCLQESW